MVCKWSNLQRFYDLVNVAVDAVCPVVLVVNVDVVDIWDLVAVRVVLRLVLFLGFNKFLVRRQLFHLREKYLWGPVWHFEAVAIASNVSHCNIVTILVTMWSPQPYDVSSSNRLVGLN